MGRSSVDRAHPIGEDCITDSPCALAASALFLASAALCTPLPSLSKILLTFWLVDPVIQAVLKFLRDYKWPSYFLQSAQFKDTKCAVSRSISQRSQERVWCSRSCSLPFLKRFFFVTCRFACFAELELPLAASPPQSFRPDIFVRPRDVRMDISRKQPDICLMTGRYNRPFRYKARGM